jgi:hypothetical protein
VPIPGILFQTVSFASQKPAGGLLPKQAGHPGTATVHAFFPPMQSLICFGYDGGIGGFVEPRFVVIDYL